jgi:hypothetical protein
VQTIAISRTASSPYLNSDLFCRPCFIHSSVPFQLGVLSHLSLDLQQNVHHLLKAITNCATADFIFHFLEPYVDFKLLEGRDCCTGI